MCDTRTAASFASTTWAAAGQSVELLVLHGRLDEGNVAALSRRDCVVILYESPTLRGLHTLSSTPSLARFLQPDHILSALAELSLSRGDQVRANEVLSTVSRLWVSSLSSDARYLAPAGASSPPPFAQSMPG